MTHSLDMYLCIIKVLSTKNEKWNRLWEEIQNLSGRIMCPLQSQNHYLKKMQRFVYTG